MNGIFKYVDDLITSYKQANKGDLPVYLILSPEEGDKLTDAIREQKQYDKEQIITSYKDLKIVRNIALLNGKAYVTNELPETSA